MDQDDRAFGFSFGQGVEVVFVVKCQSYVVWCVDMMIDRRAREEVSPTPLVSAIFHEAAPHPPVIRFDLIDVVQMCHCYALNNLTGRYRSG